MGEPSVPGNSAKAVPDLRERRRLDTRREITAAALDLFEDRGTAATTVEEIARRAGVSQSTFFRCFATKEESVLGTDAEFESAVATWLESTAPEDITLSGVEKIYERSVERVACATDEDIERVLRIRRLIIADSHLCTVAVAADSVTLARVTDIVARALAGTRPRSYARLLVESAGMTMRVAFDTWAERVDSGQEDADLAEIYRATRDQLRHVTSRPSDARQ
ncbi:AcrR family transcriptional regulator [Rhodococcus sp. 27YEA15]|uniref:TetR/AcrR family transcriptional regulator n=1 Tax=Rhodococcus sp. 27YEA15 TaxID=3156259 RepID=UPI003C79770C